MIRQQHPTNRGPASRQVADSSKRSSRPRLWWLFTIVILLIAVSSANVWLLWDRTGSTARLANLTGGQGANAEQFAPSVSPPHDPIVKITKPLDVAAADVGKQDWPTELLTDRIDGQLQALGRILSSPSQMTTDGLSNIVSRDVTSINLNPSTKAMLHNENFEISRAIPEPGGSARRETVGIPKLANAIAALFPSGANFTQLHAKFKIVHIDAKDHNVTTTIRVALYGHASDRWWQHNAQWNCDWNTATGSPMLTRIESVPDAFEQVTYHQSQPFFSDQTQSYLGQLPCYQGQLQHDTNYWLSRLEASHGIDLLGSHGISVADVNGDGEDDLYICQPGGLPNRLLITSPQGQLWERAAEVGLDILDSTRGALFIDLDNDGDQDAALVIENAVVIFEHVETGKFIVRQRIEVPIGPTFVIAADFNSDSLLDLYVLNHDAANPSGKEIGILGTPIPFHDANNGGANMLLRNQADFQFVDVTAQVGLDSNNRRFSLAGCWEDYDDDGDMDIYVANDFGRNNLYRNDDGVFHDVAGELGVEDLSAGMSVSWGDVNNDGVQDLYVSNMFSSAGNRIAYQRPFHAGESLETRTEFQRHARGNSLFVQSPHHAFQDQSVSANVTMGRWAWASKFADVNNDGRLDILIANGFVTNEDTGDL